MPTAEEQLTIAQRRLTEVESLAKTLQTLREELTRYQATLSRKLIMLKQAEVAPAPAQPVTTIAQDIISDLEASGEPIQADVELVQDVARAELEVVEPETAPQPEPEAYEEEGEGSERRTSSRRKGNPIQLRITRLDSGDLLEGWVVDRSSGGMRLLLDQALPAKTMLSIRPVKAATNYPWIKAEVRNCKPERGGYSLGCMFLQKLTWGELQAFG